MFAARSLTRQCSKFNSSTLRQGKSFFRPPQDAIRSFSTSKDLMEKEFEPTQPSSLTIEMAEGIADATQFYIRHGVSNQRLRHLAADPNMAVITKWQKMMEVFLLTQVHVIAAIGYAPDEHGLQAYAHDLATCIQQSDDTMRDLFTEVRRDTWRELVATCFQLDKEDIPTLEIVDARNLMHKVASRMIAPEVLLKIQTLASKIENEDVELELAAKHQVLQNIIVNDVYLGGSPSLVEEFGFGSGPEAYAKVQ
jgi:hypothetical protein